VTEDNRERILRTKMMVAKDDLDWVEAKVPITEALRSPGSISLSYIN
jgi:hypothetical protein